MRSLHGLRILNTRPAHQAASLTRKLEANGGIVFEHPLISIQKPADCEPLLKALHHLANYQWIIFTSYNSIQLFFQFIEEENIDTSPLGTMKFAVVGEKTVEALQKQGFSAHVVPEKFDGDHLAKELLSVLHKEEKVLFPKSSLARDVITSTLRQADIMIDDPIIYETVHNITEVTRLNSLLTEATIDLVIFTSPSAVHSFFQQVEKSVLDSIKGCVRFAVIGSITAAALSQHGISHYTMAVRHTMDGLIETIIHESTLKEDNTNDYN